MKCPWGGPAMIYKDLPCQNLKYPLLGAFLDSISADLPSTYVASYMHRSNPFEGRSPQQGCAVVIYLHVALLMIRSRRLNLRWSRMHRRSPAPPRCANASPPPLCTCSRCSCPLVSLFGTEEHAG
jgi:hypothetical protein